jgi:hypothetical protein
MTLGASNAPVGGAAALPLYDRFALAPAAPPAPAQGDRFRNIGEFNRIMRICNYFDAATDTVLSGQLNTIANATVPTTPVDFTQMDFPQEAQIRFDFKAAPWLYSSPSNPPSPPTIKGGDKRAVQLLDQIAVIDRVYDASIDTGYGPVSIQKLRLPGRINVNTASGMRVAISGTNPIGIVRDDVLRAIPNMTDQAVANIVAYRERKKLMTLTPSTTITYNGAVSPDFTDSSNFPGGGIRSLGELLYCLPRTGATLDARDALWASIYNYCTVRSDTFVVYGYMEALRAHPKGTNNNGSDWYGGGVTDDPTASGVPVLRMAKRRWVAIVDRSFCNYPRTDATNFTLPRVVAINDLPH